MRIRTQLIAGVVVFGVLIVIISGLVLLTNQQIERFQGQDEIATRIALETGDLGYLSDDYILHRDPRQAERWREQYAAVSALVANLSVDRPEQQVIAGHLGLDLNSSRTVFEEIAAGRPTPGGAASLEVARLSWGRMSVQTQGMVFEAGQLAGLLQDETDALRETRSLLILALLGTFMAFLVASYALVFRRTLASIAELQEGARIVGSGNFEHAVDDTADDEIGDLARSFNRMTADLRGATASKADLEREMGERMQAEQALRRSNEDLQRFAYVASHDLQEPLRSVVSFSQLLERRYKGKLDADADEFLAFIIEGGQRMQTLIRDLLAFSRVETAARPFEPTDAGTVVAGVVRAMETPIREAGATVEVGPMPTVMADAAQLEQVFVNLIGNAIKYRHPERPPVVGVSAEERNGWWEFAVADNGIGIEAEYFDRIFEMFQRLHTQDEFSGTGIGLAVVKRIVERHGGAIRVASTPGEGSTFVFTLPAA